MAPVTDLTGQPKLVKQVGGKAIGLRYLLSSWSIWNLERHIYIHGYNRWRLGLFAFEIDENERPWWIVTLEEPTIQYRGMVISKVLLVDPQTGQIDPYDPNSVPKWVDTVLSENIVRNRSDWYARYPHSYVQSVATERDVMQLYYYDEDRLARVWDKNGEPFYILDLNIRQGAGYSLAAMFAVNSRTGEAREYLLSGSNEVAAHLSLSSEISNYGGWYVANLTPVNLSGREVWSGPILSNADIFQRFGLVDVRLGISVVGTGRVDAYRKLVARWSELRVPFSDSAITSRSFKVAKVGRDIRDGNQIYSLTETGNPHIYVGSSTVSSDLPLVEQGNEVTVMYLKSDEALGNLIPILKFRLN